MGKRPRRFFPKASTNGKDCGSVSAVDREERAAWARLIRDLRRGKDLDQEQLASLADTTRRTIGSIERGDSVPQEDVLRRVLGVLGIDPEPETSQDVRNFIALITPLLERLPAEVRAELQPRIVTMIADQFAAPAAPTPDVVHVPLDLDRYSLATFSNREDAVDLARKVAALGHPLPEIKEDDGTFDVVFWQPGVAVELMPTLAEERSRRRTKMSEPQTRAARGEDGGEE